MINQILLRCAKGAVENFWQLAKKAPPKSPPFTLLESEMEMGRGVQWRGEGSGGSTAPPLRK